MLKIINGYKKAANVDEASTMIGNSLIFQTGSVVITGSVAKRYFIETPSINTSQVFIKDLEFIAPSTEVKIEVYYEPMMSASYSRSMDNIAGTTSSFTSSVNSGSTLSLVNTNGQSNHMFNVKFCEGAQLSSSADVIVNKGTLVSTRYSKSGSIDYGDYMLGLKGGKYYTIEATDLAVGTTTNTCRANIRLIEQYPYD